jgi:hypothetical protein
MSSQNIQREASLVGLFVANILYVCTYIQYVRYFWYDLWLAYPPAYYGVTFANFDDVRVPSSDQNPRHLLLCTEKLISA